VICLRARLATIIMSSTAQTSRTAYSQGHSASVVASHASRTVQNSAAFLLPHIKPHFTIVDLGCGPGTITRGFCAFVPHGSVIGIDASPAVIEQARSLAPASEYPNLSFRVGDITERLPFEDESVDVVYTHQTLLHLPRPIPVLEEARRILKPGGLLAMREWDRSDWHPADPMLTASMRYVSEAARATGAQGSGTGRRLHVWAAAAGFERGKMRVGVGGTCYTAPDEAKWWAEVHIGRLEGEVGRHWVEDGIVPDQEEVDAIKAALRRWAESDDAWSVTWQGEVLCWK